MPLKTNIESWCWEATEGSSWIEVLPIPSISAGELYQSQKMWTGEGLQNSLFEGF